MNKCWLIQSHTNCLSDIYLYLSFSFVDYNWTNIYINEALNMNVSTENFTSPEVHPSANLTTDEDLLLNGFRAGLLCFNLLFGVPTHSMFCGLFFEEEEFHQNSSTLISQFVIYFTHW